MKGYKKGDSYIILEEEDFEQANVVEVKFANWTKNGLMRHPSFKGLRTDKLAREIQPEESVESASKSKSNYAKSETLEIGGFEVPITNLDKVYWPDSDFNCWIITWLFQSIFYLS